MKKYLFPIAASLLLAGQVCVAQSADSTEKQRAEDQATKKTEEKSRMIGDKLREEDRRLGTEDKRRDEEDAKKLGDYDEIIIKKKKPDTNEKLTVEIKGDRVFVNGKPIEDFVNDDVYVKIHAPRRYELIAPSSPFRFPGSTWSLQNGNMYNGEGGVHPFLGVMTEGSDGGTKILSVTENSAAAKAGLKKDDIITRINDKPVADHKQLTEAVSSLKPDDKVTITYKRNGRENKTTAVLGKRSITRSYGRVYREPGAPEAPEAPDAPGLPDGADEAPMPPVPPMEFNFDELGNNLNRAFMMDSRPHLGIKAQDTEDGKGVKVIGVDNGSAAEKAGLKEDDVITSFDDRKVNSASELMDAARAAKDKSSVKMELKRNGRTREIELKTPKKLKTANL